MAADRSGAGGDRTTFWICAAIVVVAVAVVSYPNVGGFWGRDDFACIALARMIGAPWRLFTTDHFFAAGSVFRPLGYFSEWLCIKLFGTDYAPNAAFDIALHAAVAFFLFRALLRFSIPATVAALAALFFALHPAVIGPSMWWSGRFDVQSTLFVLVSIGAAVRYRERVTTAELVCALLAAAAATLSKENGLVSVAALTIVWGRWAWIDPTRRRRAVVAIACAWTWVPVFFVWRRLVLGTFSSGFTGTVPLSQAIPKGLLNWWHQAPGYLSFFPHLSSITIAMIVVGVVATALAAIVGWKSSSTKNRPDVDVVLIGLLLFIAPIVLQAPIAAFGAPLSADMSAIEAGMQSRLYYLQSVGVAFVLAAMIGPIYRSALTAPRVAIAASLTFVVVTFAWVSHRDAREFGQRSYAIAAPARAAMAAIDSATIPAEHCHIAFLGYDAAPEWSLFVSMDSIVKALSENKQIRHCWIHSNLPTYTRMQALTSTPADALPYPPMRTGDHVEAWRRLGHFQFAYLDPPAAIAADGAGMTFFQMKNGRFVDVTQNVAAGEIPFRLQ